MKQSARCVKCVSESIFRYVFLVCGKSYADWANDVWVGWPCKMAVRGCSNQHVEFSTLYLNPEHVIKYHHPPGCLPQSHISMMEWWKDEAATASSSSFFSLSFVSSFFWVQSAQSSEKLRSFKKKKKKIKKTKKTSWKEANYTNI